MQRNVRTCAAAAALSILSIPGALADFKDLINRIPGEANALVVIDVDKIMNSALAIREGWKEKRANAYADRPLIVPPEASRVVMAALVDLSTMAPLWEVSVMDLSKPPSLRAIARAEGGYLDAFAEKAAAWSPINAYFVQLDPLVLGAVSPANRQFAARWAARKSTLEGVFASRYLRQAARAVDSGAHVVIAMDLEGATSAPKVRRRLEAEPFASLTDAKIDVDALSQLLGSVKGVTLRVEIGEYATGKGVVDFGGDASILAKIAKPLLLEFLSEAGAQIGDLDGWQVTTKRNTVTFEGGLSTSGLQRIFSLLDPPTPLDPRDVDHAAAEAQAGSERERIRATTSKLYFQSVDRIIEKLQDRVGTGSKAASLAHSATWIQRDARRIERLPILNVDADLLKWGAEVATAMRDVAQVFKVGGLRTVARTSGITIGGIYVNYDRDRNYADARARRDMRQAQAQRKQAAMEEKTRATETAGVILKALRASISRIRMQMTERYQIEF